jgi:hypothetical protein
MVHHIQTKMQLMCQKTRIQAQSTKKNHNTCINTRKLKSMQSIKLGFVIWNHQKQLEIVSHGKVFQTLFALELVQNKTNQLN